MPKYILDLTQCCLPWPEGTPLRIPIKNGENDLDWDVCEDELSVKELLKLRAVVTRGDKPPIGFKSSKLPIGAMIQIVEE